MSYNHSTRCYLCHGTTISHLPHCPEMMDETARDKMFPGRKRVITEVLPQVPPTLPSKSSATFLEGVEYPLIAINGSLLKAFGAYYEWL